jgi:hypothetical protein
MNETIFIYSSEAIFAFLEADETSLVKVSANSSNFRKLISLERVIFINKTYLDYA